MTKHLTILIVLLLGINAEANDMGCEGTMDSSMCEIICDGEITKYSRKSGKQIETTELFSLIGPTNEFSAFGFKVQADRGSHTEVVIQPPTGERFSTTAELSTYDGKLEYEVLPKVDKKGFKVGIGLWIICQSMYKATDE